MKVVLLGAHNVESDKTKVAGVLVDDKLALDAGSIASALPISRQIEIKSVVLTHAHYDHVKDLPMLGMNLLLNGRNADVYASEDTISLITNNVISGDMYPDFYSEPAGEPTFKLHKVKPLKPMEINGYKIKPVPVNHGKSALGYSLVSKKGKSLFYTGDTGQCLLECWEHVSPELLIIEVTMPNSQEEYCAKTRHLCPNLLKQELIAFKEKKGYTPKVICVHLNPLFESEIEKEIKEVSEEFGVAISLGYEGMSINL